MKTGNLRMNVQMLSYPALRVLALMLDGGAYSGSQIRASTKMSAGSLYPLLDRLQEKGWAKSRWEVPTAHELKRPKRRYFSLTQKGKEETLKLIKPLRNAYESVGGQRDLP